MGILTRPTATVTFPDGRQAHSYDHHRPSRALIGRLDGTWQVACWLLDTDRAPAYINFYRDHSHYTDLRVVPATEMKVN